MICLNLVITRELVKLRHAPWYTFQGFLSALKHNTLIWCWYRFTFEKSDDTHRKRRKDSLVSFHQKHFQKFRRGQIDDTTTFWSYNSFFHKVVSVCGNLFYPFVSAATLVFYHNHTPKIIMPCKQILMHHTIFEDNLCGDHILISQFYVQIWVTYTLACHYR